MFFRFFILTISVFVFTTVVNSQEVVVKKSDIIENINGSDCYLHFVKKGETLYAIARAYDITVNDIFKTNPDSRNGIKPGVILKIPTGKTQITDTETAVDETLMQSNDKFFYHIVKKQETLYSISQKYKVSIADINSINPGISESLREGQTIQIPVTEDYSNFEDAKTGAYSKKHVVASGETLYGIAGMYEISTGEILNANPGLTAAELKIGQELSIPNQPDPVVIKAVEERKHEEEKFIFHKVIKGETLYSIAQKNAVSIDTLKKYNPGLTQYLAIGMEIRIPKNKDSKGYIVHHSEQKKSLVEIAELYDVDYDEVARLNPRISRKAKKGQSVKIPVEEIKAIEVTSEIEETKPDSLYNPCYFNHANKNRTYNIALLLPLFLEEIDSIEIKKEVTIEDIAAIPSLRFMDFYAGFKMAIDSMKQKGMNINLFVYDVDNKPEKADKVLYSSELSSMDLIVGPFYRKSFTKFANFAKTYKIPIINPLSDREEVIHNNPYVFKVKPDENNQLDIITNYLIETYPESNILLIRGNKYKYRAEVSFMRNTLNKTRSNHIYISNSHITEAILEHNKSGSGRLLTENKVLKLDDFSDKLLDSTYFNNLIKSMVYSSDSINTLKYSLSKIRKNVVVAMGDNIVYIKDLMSQLNKLNLKHDITLIGLPDWKEMEGLESQQKLNLDLHCFTSYAVDYNNPDVQNWVKNFRNNYKSEPTIENYAFDGFDIGWYFLNALYQAGPEFPNCLNFINTTLIHTQFNFVKDGENGYHNVYWDLGRYHDYQFQKIKIRNTTTFKDNIHN